MAGGASTASAVPIQCLPFPPELLFQIFEYCVEYDLPNDPNPQYITTSQQVSNDSTPRGGQTWINIKMSSVQDICNIRLVCKQFQDASLESFALTITNRRFRLTEIGLQDLQEVATCHSLAPYIKKLTFGSADVAQAKTVGMRNILSLVKGDNTMYQHLSGIHHALTGYHHLTERAIKNGLRDALEAFPKLASLQVDAYDRPHYLGGWLTLGQKQYIDDNFKPGTSFWHKTNGMFPPQRFYESSGWDPACSILKVLSGIGVHTHELRMSELGGSRPQTLCCLLPETLHTLHLTVDWNIHGSRYGDGGRRGDYAKVFFRALGRMLNLQYLSLGKTTRSVGIRWAKQLFETLKSASKLHRVDLKGEWILSSSILIEFVKQHADTLRCLSLNGCIMEGRWLATLHSLADLFRDRLKYFRLLNARHDDAVLWLPQLESFNTYRRSQWPSFTCITDFGPGFRLLPDPNEIELWDGSGLEEAWEDND